MTIEGEAPKNEIKPYEPTGALSTEQIKFEEFEAPENAHLRDYLNVILRRKRVVTAFFIAVVCLVTIFTYTMKPQYKATTVIRINNETPDVYTLKDIQIQADDGYNETQFKILRSRTLARQTIDRMKLYDNPNFNPWAPGASKTDTFMSSIEEAITGIFSFLSTKDDNASDIGPYHPDEGVYRFLTGKFLANVDVLPVKASQLVNVSFISPDPALAQQTANAIADAYMDYTLNSRLDASKQEKAVLDKQLDAMKSKVEVSEQALDDYATKNGMLIVDNKDDKQNIMIDKLSAISQAMSAATTKKLQAEALDRELARPGIENPTLINNSLIEELGKQYAALEARYYNLLNIYKPDYPKMRMLKSQMKAIQRSINSEKRKVIGSITSDYQTDLRSEKYLSDEYEKQKSMILDYQKTNSQYQILKRDVDANREIYGSLLDRLKQVSVAATRTTTNIQVLDRAELPNKPFKPNKPVNILLSIIFGLGGGIGLAFFMEYFDNTFKNTREIERATRLPALGIIPMQKLPGVIKRPMIAYSQSRSPVAEAFRSIGTFIMLSSSVKPPKSILVTSPGEKEGKTTICINTAMALAESMGKGVIIDADLRKPKLHHSFEVDNAVGLSTFLSGNIEFEDALIKKTRVNGLNIITSGPLSPNPSELIVSRRMKDLLEALYATYDFVIIDSPPLMGMSDSVYLSRIVDGSVIVIKAGETTKHILVETKKVFRNINSRILGVVLNGINESDLKYNYYSNYYSSYFKG